MNQSRRFFRILCGMSPELGVRACAYTPSPPILDIFTVIPKDPILTRATFVSMISIKGCLYRQVAIPADA